MSILKLSFVVGVIKPIPSAIKLHSGCLGGLLANLIKQLSESLVGELLAYLPRPKFGNQLAAQVSIFTLQSNISTWPVE
jgi:hypothetical protein